MRGGLRARLVRCGPGCGPGVRGAGRGGAGRGGAGRGGAGRGGAGRGGAGRGGAGRAAGQDNCNYFTSLVIYYY